MSGESGATRTPSAVPGSARGGPDPAPAGSGAWARAYGIVLAALALDILLLWWLTERYR